MTSTHPSLDELLTMSIFADIDRDALAWLASRMEVFERQAGDVMIRAGETADYLFVLFEGELHAERPEGGVFVVRGGEVSGLLPYSRLTKYAVNARAITNIRGASLHKDHFPEMLARIPLLQQRLVSLMADRIRRTSADDQQREKLLALGKISAGLAHELNNPAAAARRAADNLRQAVDSARRAVLQLDKRGLPAESRVFLAIWTSAGSNGCGALGSR